MSTTFFPAILERRLPAAPARALSFGLGVLLLVICAQISIPVPGTPVPITGQTFGVELLALLWGRRLSFAAFCAYLLLGTFGLPVFASGAAGLNWGPRVGYLGGMLAATWIVGGFAERGWNRSFGRSFAACVCGSLCIFAGGLSVLSFFVPGEFLFAKGLWPFLPGDLLKNLAAAAIASRLSRSRA